MPRPALPRGLVLLLALLSGSAARAADRLAVEQHAIATGFGIIPQQPALGHDALGDFVVYTRVPSYGAPAAILMQRIDATGAPVGAATSVSTGSTNDQQPDANGSRVVYLGYDTGSSIVRVMLWDSTTGITQALTDWSTNLLHPRIHGDVVTWMSAFGDVWYYDITWGGSFAPLLLLSPSVHLYDLGERYLPWDELPPGAPGQVWAYDLLSGFVDVLATGALVTGWGPVTSGRWVLWGEQGVDLTLHALDVDSTCSTCTVDHRLVYAENASIDTPPSADGDFLAWQSYSWVTLTSDFYLYRFSDGATFPLALGPGAYPRVGGNRIAYVSYGPGISVATFNFIPQVALSVAKTGAGSGTVVSTPAGIDCGTACSAGFDSGSAVTLSAAPTGGSVFAGWDLCPGLGTCTVTMDAAQTVTATFAPPPPTWPLAVNFAGTGTGSVTATANGAPLALSCTSTGCTGAPPQGGWVVLTETPGAGMIFKGWGIVCTGTATTCAFTMNAAKTVQATFAPKTLALTVAMAGSGVGNVTSDAFDVDGVPVSLNCTTGSTAGCSGAFPNGVTVTLAASWDAAQVIFKGWSVGTCPGAPATCKVTLTDPRNVTATFQPATYPLTVTVGGAGQGTVTGPGAGGASINCTTGSSSGCTAPEPNGPAVTLIATPAAGSVFKSWSGCSSVSGSNCSVYMTSARTVAATFEPASFTLTLTFSGSGTGTVTGVSWTSCDAAGCTASVANGANVTLTESPTGASVWKGWGIVCAGTATTCSFKMNAAKTVVATFWAQ